MLRKQKSLVTVLGAFVCALFVNVSCAGTTSTTNPAHMVQAQKAIANLNQVITSIKQKTSLPVPFPQQIFVPAPKQQYYASSTVNADGSYNISVDTTADCNGAKSCSIGSITVAKSGQPQTTHSAPNGPNLTQAVKLVQNNQGYYTPAHVEADSWPAMVEWNNANGVLYSVMWKTPTDGQKEVLVQLANSVIRAGA